jgi:hypothetical protein
MVVLPFFKANLFRVGSAEGQHRRHHKPISQIRMSMRAASRWSDTRALKKQAISPEDHDPRPAEMPMHV